MNLVAILTCVLACSGACAAEGLEILDPLIGRWEGGLSGAGVEPFLAITRISRRVDGVWAETAASVEQEGGGVLPVSVQFSGTPEGDRVYARTHSRTGRGVSYSVARDDAGGLRLEQISEDGLTRRIDLHLSEDRELVVTIFAGASEESLAEVASRTLVPGSLRVQAGALSFLIDRSWERLEPRTSSVLAGLALPAGAADGLGASLLIFYFGEKGAGLPADNLDRWISQVRQPVAGGGERDSTRADARVRQLQVGGMRVDALEISGTYRERDLEPTPGVAMWAAIVDAPGGPCYFKALGPAGEISRWHDELELLLQSLAHAPR